jgi:hypothetical protein
MTRLTSDILHGQLVHTNVSKESFVKMNEIIQDHPEINAAKAKSRHQRTFSERLNPREKDVNTESQLISVLSKYKLSEDKESGWWITLSRSITCCCLSSMLTRLNIIGPNVQQAWREKVFNTNR